MDIEHLALNPKAEADAICFTSGPACAPFAAGVIHAWLAVDRPAPTVAAGISLGAVSAAAMKRVYAELAEASPEDLEKKRWEWFRRYLTAVTDNPIAAIWDSIPDPVDFYASTPPVKDGSVPDELYEDSEDARRHYYILIQLGIWLAHLPLRISTIANIVVSRVRIEERYGSVMKWPTFWWNCLKALTAVAWHLLRSPMPVVEGFFFKRRANMKARKHSHMIRPLFGWIWATTLGAFSLIGAAVILLVVKIRATGFAPERLAGARIPLGLEGHPSILAFMGWLGSLIFGCLLVALALIVIIVVLVGILAAVKRARGGKSFGFSIAKHLIGPLDITLGLIKPYEAKRQLHDLFGEGTVGASFPLAKDLGVRLLVVCAALEATEQICLREHVPIVDALTAAISIPGLFPPVLFSAKDVPPRSSPVATSDSPGRDLPAAAVHVIDGAAVRSNPIPAFFEWCKEPDNRRTVLALERQDHKSPSLHVVYSVPIEYEGSVQDAPAPSSLDIVESALLSLRLEKRRDTRQEVRQTNYTSRLQEIRRRVTGEEAPGRGPFTIFADEIAPRTDLDTGDDLKPDRVKSLQTVAAGCRATLETLYQAEIILEAHGSPMKCATFLESHSGRRKADACGSITGLPEVCQHCTGTLTQRHLTKARLERGVMQTYGDPGKAAKEDLSKQLFRHLATTRPKVVFLGSGGVFRGAFHIGVIAAMVNVKLYPDLVVGASVGALMGGALCNMSTGDSENETAVLTELVQLFLKVDERVALTKTLKNAAKQLGTRARGIRLSPAELARMIKRGSQADAGYASTGAPPALTDALSYLFTLPHRTTTQITSEFIAGHISSATSHFLREVRKETLVNFDVQNAIMGVSLLEQQVENLMRGTNTYADLGTFQPFHKHAPQRKPVSFFCTTSFLNAKISLLLGRDFLTENPSWNVVFAGLSSSAFPVVFAPRRESDILPGRGRADRFFGDGGMFDNLPFLPAIEVLAAVQKSEACFSPQKNELSPADLLEYRMNVLTAVEERAKSPNVFIAAGLDARPAKGGLFDTLFKIRKRAGSLSVDSKVSTFINGAKKTVADMSAIASMKSATLTAGDLDFLDKSVAAKVVYIAPTDAEHINPTFAFCRTTGLKTARVQRSIADGCFQSLAAFSGDAADPAIKAAMSQQGISLLRIAKGRAESSPGNCPFFMLDNELLACPFAKSKDANVSAVYRLCCNDKAHCNFG